MLQNLSPCHYHYFGYLSRRYRSVVNMAQGVVLPPSLSTALANLGRDLPQHRSLGIRTPLPLDEMLDDTSTESFLNTLDERIGALESNIYPLISTIDEESYADALDTAGLWGRRIAQEALMADGGPKPRAGRLEGVWVLATLYLAGGDWVRPPFLLRRSTATELSYITLSCPHRRHENLPQLVRDRACRAEAAMYAGFYETLSPGFHFSRNSRDDACMDFISSQR